VKLSPNQAGASDDAAIEASSSSSGKAGVLHPFWVIVRKEIGDHVRSWRYIVLLVLMALTCIGSLYAAIQGIRHPDADTQQTNDLLGDAFVFLKLFTESNGTLPPFITFVSFIGPLLGIGLGFDAVNAERGKGTLSRLMSQPIHRDYVINGKFVGALAVISAMFAALVFMMLGVGLVVTGIQPSPEEFWRMMLFLALSICYVAFWLNLAIVFSIRFRQAATSALTCIAIWIFFSVFYSMIIDLIGSSTYPGDAASTSDLISHTQWMQFLMRLSPGQLFSEATSTLLTPSVRNLGPLTMDQVIGAIPSPLPLSQSILLVWPQVTALIALTAICFGLSYALFMRQEIRSR